MSDIRAIRIDVGSLDPFFASVSTFASILDAPGTFAYSQYGAPSFPVAVSERPLAACSTSASVMSAPRLSCSEAVSLHVVACALIPSRKN